MEDAARRFVFTEKRIRDLPAPAEGDRAIYLDADCPGLQLRVTSNGVRTFFIRYRARGASSSERFTLGRWPTLSVIDARSLAREKLGQVAAADNPAEALRELRGELTLGQLFRDYCADRRQAGKRRVADVEQQWQRWLGKMPAGVTEGAGRSRRQPKPAEAVDWEARRLSEVTFDMVEQLHRRITAKHSPFVANHVVEILRAVYGYARRKRLVTENPAEAITLNPKPSRERFLQAHELDAFEAAVHLEEQPWRDLFMVLLYVGYRRGATIAMRWQDVDLKAGTWAVPGENAKNGQPIVLPIAGKALTVLRKRQSDDARHATWVFPGETAAGHVGPPKKAWARVCERAGLTDVRVHDLRRTLGSWMAMSGLSLPAIGRALGHKDSRSTEVYARLQADAVKHAVDVAHQSMRKAAKGSNVVPLAKGRRAR